MTQSLEASAKPDRLAAFFDAFQLKVRVLEPGMAPSADSSVLYSVLYLTAGDAAAPAGAAVLRVRGGGGVAAPPALVTAEVDFGSARNPLLNTLPDTVSVPLGSENPALMETARAFLAEASAARCGRRHAMDRLGEVIVLMVLRAAIEGGAARPCLLAGLAHPHLHRALVAMHEAPGHPWDTDALAHRAGMSRSRFMALFPQVIGATPMAYLTAWRVQCGRRELLKGNDKVKAVARRVGFSSAEAFSRAYAREFGVPPAHELRTRA